MRGMVMALVAMIQMLVLSPCAAWAAGAEKSKGTEMKKPSPTNEDLLVCTVTHYAKEAKWARAVSYSVCEVEPSERVRKQINLGKKRYISVHERENTDKAYKALKIDILRFNLRKKGDAANVYRLKIHHWQAPLAGSTRLLTIKFEKGKCVVVKDEIEAIE